MMNKKDILKRFSAEDGLKVINLFEKCTLAKDRDIPIFGNDFYTPNVWRFFEEKFSSSDFKVISNGYFEESERRMISFNNIYEMPYPYKVIEIKCTSKFANQTHRDFLGSLLGLGIERDKIGDLLVKDNICYVPVCEEIENFILNNLVKVGKYPCEVQVITDEVLIPEVEFDECIILVQTLRLDSIVSKIIKVSRGKAQSMIDEGKVLVDYNSAKDKSIKIEAGKRITIRGFGKFILGEVVGNSKSGKFKVIVKKYT